MNGKLANRAVLALTVISLAGILAGLIIAWHGSPIDGVGPIIAGAVGGIVAIVLRNNNGRS